MGSLVVDGLGRVATWTRRNASGGSSGRCLLLGSLVAFTSRTLNRVLGNLDNLAPPPLLTVGALRQCGMDRGERRQHGLVQRRLVGVDGRSVLAQVVQS